MCNFLGLDDCEFDVDKMCYWDNDLGNLLNFNWEGCIGIIFLSRIGLFGDYMFGIGNIRI